MKSMYWRWFILVAVFLTVTVAAVVKYRGDRSVRPVSTGEEIAVAEDLLARKLSGPRYFNAPLKGIHEEGGPWIEVEDALPQVQRIVAERELGSKAASEVRRLVDQLAESHPYRVVGGKRINLPRLNLSLDAIDK